MAKGKRSRMGRPPRTDQPVRVGFMLPAALQRWLQGRARVEGRPQGYVLTSALELYRKQVTRRGRTT